jgi:hypothetical protein
VTPAPAGLGVAGAGRVDPGLRRSSTTSGPPARCSVRPCWQFVWLWQSICTARGR